MVRGIVGGDRDLGLSVMLLDLVAVQRREDSEDSEDTGRRKNHKGHERSQACSCRLVNAVPDIEIRMTTLMAVAAFVIRSIVLGSGLRASYLCGYGR